MGALTIIVDAILFFFFLFIVFAAPLIDGQIILPLHLYPKNLVDIKSSYAKDYGDYLVIEKPHFFVGIVWLELLFQWPLALASLYGILASKTWLNSTCLMYGISTFSCMAAILSELMGAGRASESLLKVYATFMGFAILAFLRGALAHSGHTTTIGKRPALNRKKRA